MCLDFGGPSKERPTLSAEFQIAWLNIVKAPTYFGSLCENIVVIEVVRFFMNRGEPAQIFFLRSKEKVEVDLLIGLPNQRYIAAEVKLTAQGFTEPKLKLIDSLGLNIVAKWVITLTADGKASAEIFYSLVP